MEKLFKTWVVWRLESTIKSLIKTKRPLLVGVTGSVGKTSTKQAIAKVLGQKYKVQARTGNYNSEIGLPLSILDMDVPPNIRNPLAWFGVIMEARRRVRLFNYDCAVLELGADKPGDIAYFMRYLQPDVGVVTAVGPTHLEQFGTVEAVLNEKFILADHSRTAVLNADDEILMRRSGQLRRPAITFGLDHGDVIVTDIKPGSQGLQAKLVLKNRELVFNSRVIAKHSLLSLAAAAAVGLVLDVTDQQIKTGIEDFSPVNGRMNPLRGINNSLIIDDSYNSSPDAAIAALESLYDFDGPKVAVLGSMNELGSFEKDGHETVGRKAAKVDLLVTIGRAATAYLATAAANAGLDEAKINKFQSPDEAGEFLASHLPSGATVLVKGSQNGVFAEEAIKHLLANPSDADRLVRQSADWLVKKRAQFQA